MHIAYRRAGSGPPLVLLHGWPQHSLMWNAIAPRLAEHFTVVVPDLRGAGASTIARNGYDKATMARDIHNLTTALELGPICLAGYDLGAGVACAFARQFRNDVRRLAVMEFALAGFGFEQQMVPQSEWTLASNWHLALFSVPEAAEWLCRGRERELLSWFFWHLSYAGGQVSAVHFEEYVRQVSKPGALRAGIEYYATVRQDALDNAELKEQPLSIPGLALGGEASSAVRARIVKALISRLHIAQRVINNASSRSRSVANTVGAPGSRMAFVLDEVNTTHLMHSGSGLARCG